MLTILLSIQDPLDNGMLLLLLPDTFNMKLELLWLLCIYFSTNVSLQLLFQASQLVYMEQQLNVYDQYYGPLDPDVYDLTDSCYARDAGSRVHLGVELTGKLCTHTFTILWKGILFANWKSLLSSWVDNSLIHAKYWIDEAPILPPPFVCEFSKEHRHICNITRNHFYVIISHKHWIPFTKSVSLQIFYNIADCKNCLRKKMLFFISFRFLVVQIICIECLDSSNAYYGKKVTVNALVQSVKSFLSSHAQVSATRITDIEVYERSAKEKKLKVWFVLRSVLAVDGKK